MTILAHGVPESIQFLNWGWWLIHLVAIPTVLYIGYAIGRKKAHGPTVRQRPGVA